MLVARFGVSGLAALAARNCKAPLTRVLGGRRSKERISDCIPTAVYPNPGGAGHPWRFFNGQATTPMCELDWQSLGVLELTALELTALPSIKED